MKNKTGEIYWLFVILVILLTITGGLTQSAQAATCTWQGSSTDWYDTDNWGGCVDSYGNPSAPGGGDDVILPAFATYYPVLTIYQDNIVLNSLTINVNAQLTIDQQTTITAGQFDNAGTITIEEKTGHWLRINAPFNNTGTVNFGSEAALILYQAGTHTGSFTGRQLSFFKSATQMVNTFQVGSSIGINVLVIQEHHTVNVEGQFNCHEKNYINDFSILDLSKANILNQGTVVLRGGKLITDTIPIGETFSGTGTIQADLTNSGTISPGTSPGTLTVDGTYTQESTGTLAIEIGGTTPDTEHDQLVVTGAGALDGTLDVTLINDFTPALGQSFTILTYASRTGTFSAEDLPDLDPGLYWETAYRNTSVVLYVRESGSISGTVNYTGSEGFNPVTVGVFTDPEDPPVHVTSVTSTTGVYSYTLTGLLPGTYFVRALMDLNGNTQPDPNEPISWYIDVVNGEPKPIIISGEDATYTNIDVNLQDPGNIEGTVTYIGLTNVTGPISVLAHKNILLEEEPVAIAGDIQSGETFQIEGLPAGEYFISALVDLNSSGGPPDEGEPFVWFDENGDGSPDQVIVQPGETLQGIDIVIESPTITSESSTSFTIGQEGSFTAETTGQPTPEITLEGDLPDGVSFIDNGDGTGLLSGTPAGGTQGTYILDLKASNGVDPDAVQEFTLTVIDIVTESPTITSESSTSFTIGQEGSFIAETTGQPTPEITLEGDLPDGVSFIDNGDGTGLLSGTPAWGTQGTYIFDLKASNGVDLDALQEFTLTVEGSNINLFLPLIVR
jgi:uncharacterized protein (DUF2141 family)